MLSAAHPRNMYVDVSMLVHSCDTSCLSYFIIFAALRSSAWLDPERISQFQWSSLLDALHRQIQASMSALRAGLNTPDPYIPT